MTVRAKSIILLSSRKGDMRYATYVFCASSTYTSFELLKITNKISVEGLL